eukprot:196745-Rhodomonas_salina.2
MKATSLITNVLGAVNFASTDTDAKHRSTYAPPAETDHAHDPQQVTRQTSTPTHPDNLWLRTRQKKKKKKRRRTSFKTSARRPLPQPGQTLSPSLPTLLFALLWSISTRTRCLSLPRGLSREREEQRGM